MSFVHRLAAVGFVLAGAFAILMESRGQHGVVWADAVRITLALGGGFAVLAYLLAWLVRGRLSQ